MEKLTLKAFANKQKLSIFNVMKMVREGSVTHRSELENGKEVIYIIEDKTKQEEVSDKISRPLKLQNSLEKEIETLKREIALLRKDIGILKAKL